ncbi:MAG: NmrA family NAD(P)-binding protein, partial [Phenylobacterium sp.]
MTIAVLGATGAQGGAVVRALLSRGQPVRALTRRPDSEPALALARKGVEVVPADLDRPDTLVSALRGASSVFSVQDFYAPGVGLAGEIRQGRALISAARSAGVPHIVQSTMGEGRTPGGPAHFLSKAVLEQDLRKSGLGWTFLGTVWFLDNLLNPAMQPSLIFPV